MQSTPSKLAASTSVSASAPQSTVTKTVTPLVGQRPHRVEVEAVSLVNPVWDVRNDLRSEFPQPVHDDRRAADAVDIEVPEHADRLAV